MDGALVKDFPHLHNDQHKLFERLAVLSLSHNQRVNLFSRKTTLPHLFLHIAHSLAIIRYGLLAASRTIFDFGTGGGFPGLPLAIAYPDKMFILNDSIGKKTQAVQHFVEELGLSNVRVLPGRAEHVPEQMADCVIVRAVAPAQDIVKYTAHIIRGQSPSAHRFFCWKGGDMVHTGALYQELQRTKLPYTSFRLSEEFASDFFDKKYIIALR